MFSNSISIIVGSQNPVKINAVAQAFKLLWPNTKINCQGINAPSGVSEQPMTEAETHQGAVNRSQFCQQQGGADIYVAIEGGVDQFAEGAATFACIAIYYQQQLYLGRSALLPLPINVYNALVAGEELGAVMDKLFNTQNIKQKGGAIGLLTHGAATRENIYTQAMLLALAPILNPTIYTK